MKMTPKFISFLAALSMTATIPAAVLTVDNKPESVAMFSSFGAAYQAATDGDTILLAGSPTPYGERINLQKRLTIQGPGYLLEENNIPSKDKNYARIGFRLTHDILNGSVNGTVLQGLDLLGADSGLGVEGIVFRGCRIGGPQFSIKQSFLFERCYIGASVLGSESSIVFSNCYFKVEVNLVKSATVNHCVFGGLLYTSADVSVTNSILIAAGETLETFLARNDGSFSYCMSIGGSFLPDEAGNINNASLNSVFVNAGSDDAKWQLKENSPAKGAGLDGVDMGMFGGASPYLLSGLPALARITRLVVPSTVTETSGMTFEVDAVIPTTTP